MPGWFAEAWTTWTAWWWVIPLLCMALCIVMCFLFRSGRIGDAGRWSCCMGHRKADLEEIRKEIAGLRQTIGQGAVKPGGSR